MFAWRCRDKSHSPSGDETKQSRCLTVVDSRCPTNREQMPQVKFQNVEQKQIPVQRVQKKIEIPQSQLAQETMRSEIGRMTLENTFEEQDTLNQAVVRILNEAARAWSIECLRHEVQAGNGDAGASLSTQT